MKIMLQSNIARLIPLTFTLVGFGSSIKSATAATFPFEVFYDTSVTLTPIPGSDVSRADVSGTNPDAPYGLTNFTSLNYSRTILENNVPIQIIFNPDPAAFGLQDLPIGTDRFFGSGEDQLIGISSATAQFDFPNNQLVGSGTETITGGSGRFSGATGTLTFTESEPLDADPTAPLKGQAFLNGSINVPERVPEPTATTALISIALMGAGSVVRRLRQQASV
ncbi:MAG: hypothetical protein DSM106950_26420 [Stigonema ocellatum SAG 48.90 = DSM 106950]|nr:hypothetical protein [Stigonema ocellatum SAG 48.90 = DSM 106950]